MDEKTYKTGATQREAVKRYQAKNKNMYKTISITLPTAEAVASREILKAHNVAPVELWRQAIARLQAESTDTEPKP